MKFHLPEQPTWKIRDSSKFDTFLRCNRRFFFEYVLGWRIAQPNHDLYFGECWHIAREHQLIHGYENYLGAYEAFEAHYRNVSFFRFQELFRA